MSKDTWAASLATAIIAVIVGESVLASTSSANSSSHPWELGLGLLGILLFLIICALAMSIRRSGPRLVIDQVEVEDLSISEVTEGVAAGASTTSVTKMTTFVYTSVQEIFLNIRNDANGRHDRQNAEEVAITLRYLRDGQKLCELPARWLTDLQRISYEEATAHSARTLIANGVRHKFDVAVRFISESEMYAVDNMVRYKDWKGHPLGSSPVTLEVLARGRNVSSAERWTLSISEYSLDLVPISRPGIIGRVGLSLARRIESKWSPKQPASSTVSIGPKGPEVTRRDITGDTGPAGPPSGTR